MRKKRQKLLFIIYSIYILDYLERIYISLEFIYSI